MVKRLIFDLDNTLISWKDEYCELPFLKSLKRFNIDCDARHLSNLVYDYDDNYDRYDKKSMIEFFNKNIDTEVDMNFLDDFLYNIGFCSDVDDKVVDTLEYLSSKYELVVLTNFFTIPQFNRLKNVGIDKYFSKVIGADEYKKPQKEAFINACGGLDIESCIMIGDNYYKDIVGASDAGLKTLFFNYDRRDNPLNFEEFYEFSDLKDIL